MRCRAVLIAVSSRARTLAAMTRTRSPLRTGLTTIAAATLLTGCGGTADKPATTTPQSATAGPATPAFHGQSLRVADAVERLDTALADGDVLRLCRGGAIFTPAVVESLEGTGMSCEATVEDLLASGKSGDMGVAEIELEHGLATAKVSLGASRTKVPLTLLRDHDRWLISFSRGTDPLTALFG